MRDTPRRGRYTDCVHEDESPQRRRRPKPSKQPADKKTEEPPPVSIRSVAKKIGESDDNLKSREEWFRRRTKRQD